MLPTSRLDIQAGRTGRTGRRHESMNIRKAGNKAREDTQTGRAHEHA